MPGIDYRRLRAEIPMREVLKLIGFEPTSRRGDRLRGACPLPACQERESPTFSVELGRGICHCFACGGGGNQLDLWAQLQSVSFHESAKLLCHRTNTPIPWLTSPNR